MFALVATTVIVVLVVYVLSFLTQDILYLKRFFLCVCVCVCVPLLHLNHTRRHFHVSDFITQWGRVRECGA